MPTNRAYGTCYAIHTNMLTHGLLTCLRMVYMAFMRSSSTWTSVFMVMFYTNVDMHAQQPPTVAWVVTQVHSVAQPWLNHGSTNGSACTLQVHYVAQHDCWRLTRVHEHAGSGATHLSLVAHHPLSIDMLPHGLYVTRVPPIGVVLALC